MCSLMLYSIKIYTKNGQCSKNVINFCIAMLCCGAVFSLYFLLQNYSVPLLDMHGFRQTQTAISSFWMKKEGTILPYQTPVFGYPWMIPYEFPLYQGLAAGVSILGLPLDFSGRIVSYFFFILLLIPIYNTFKIFNIDKCLFYIFSCLYISSPAYIFWGRAFLIETTALFFCLSGSLCILIYSKLREGKYLYSALLLLSIGAVVKGTTYPQCIFFGISASMLTLYNDNTLFFKKKCLIFSRIIIISILPVVIGLLWVYYCDGIKNATIMSKIHASGSLKGWYSIDVKFLLKNIKLFNSRMFFELIGSPWVFYIAVVVALFSGLKTACSFFLFVFCFIMPIVLFTHVHIVHNYYQASNGIFLIFAISISVYSLQKINIKALIPIAVIFCMVVNYMFFYSYFYKIFLNTKILNTNNDVIKIAKTIKKNTDEKNVVFLFGLDWSPEVPYYSQRKSVMFPFWLPPKIFKKSIDNYCQLAGDEKIGAILVCPDKKNDNFSYYKIVDSFLETLSPQLKQETANNCILYSYSK